MLAIVTPRSGIDGACGRWRALQSGVGSLAG
jgi:hypothetical protein